MGVDHRVVCRDLGEYVGWDALPGNTRTHGLVVGDLALVAALLALRPPEPAGPLLGRWYGRQVTAFGDSANGDLAAAGGDPFADDHWVTRHCEDIGPAVAVLLDRLGLSPLPTGLLEQVDRQVGDTFLRFGRCAAILGFEEVAALLNERLGAGWQARWRDHSASRVAACERQGWEPERAHTWSTVPAEPGVHG